MAAASLRMFQRCLSVGSAPLTVKPHVPLIQFRKGGNSSHGSVPQAAGQMATIAKTGKVTVSSVVLEDWQLPPRYRRKPIDEQEVEWINRGGPE